MRITRKQKTQVKNQPKPPYSKQKLAKPGIEKEMDQKPLWRSSNYLPAKKMTRSRCHELDDGKFSSSFFNDHWQSAYRSQSINRLTFNNFFRMF